MRYLQSIKVEEDAKVVEDARGEGGAEQEVALVDVAKELEGVGVGGVAAEDGAGLEHDLVGGEVVALEEDELVLVGEVEGPGGVLHEAEVEGLDAGGGGVGAGVGGGDELGAAEARLHVVGGGGEDGVVGDGDFEGGGAVVELGEVLGKGKKR